MVVLIAYNGDSELMEKYHTKKCDLQEAVNSTLAMIYTMAKTQKLNCYKVIYQKQPIGYVVYFMNVLYSFGIDIKFRKKDILLHWWDELKSVIGKNFVCRLYRNNTRCIDFLKKQQMEVVDENEEHNYITLLNKK